MKVLLIVLSKHALVVHLLAQLFKSETTSFILKLDQSTVAMLLVFDSFGVFEQGLGKQVSDLETLYLLDRLVVYFEVTY